jgi:hypothetical protein
MYFTGDLDAPVVLVHLKPKQADDAVETAFPVSTFEQYFDVHRNWGARMYGSDGYREFKSRFDRKQVRFLRPFNVIDFGPDANEDGLLRNLERVVDHKLQLELVPYGSDTFNASAFGVPEVKAHFQRVLRVIAATKRKYVEAANGSLGLAGEVFALRFEVARLIHAGKDGLAERVEHVSLSQGDGLGYDIRSFETSGDDRLIEVKTTKYGASTPFFVTQNEVTVSQRERERFHLYRAFDFRKSPRLFSKQGPLEQSFRLDPTEYVARIN